MSRRSDHDHAIINLIKAMCLGYLISTQFYIGRKGCKNGCKSLDKCSIGVSPANLMRLISIRGAIVG